MISQKLTGEGFDCRDVRGTPIHARHQKVENVRAIHESPLRVGTVFDSRDIPLRHETSNEFFIAGS